MARAYSTATGKKVARAVRKWEEGSLKSGRSGAKVKSRKQAIAIGLSEARKKGLKAPKKSSAARKSAKTSRGTRKARKSRA